MKRKTVCCLHCRSEISISNFDKHYKAKTCLSGGKFTLDSNNRCKYCNLDFTGMTASERANHTRWCTKNPKYEEYRTNGNLAKARIIASSSDSRKKAAEKIKTRHKEGAYINSRKKCYQTKVKNGTLNHTEETKEKIRQIALRSNHQRVSKYTHKFIDKRGREFMFDSSWEDALAIRLDELDIDWTRPEPIPWKDQDGKDHKYFPDFYLPSFDLYLDPKNPYYQKIQKEKLDIVSNQINLLILSSLEECKSFTL